MKDYDFAVGGITANKTYLWVSVFKLHELTRMSYFIIRNAQIVSELLTRTDSGKFLDHIKFRLQTMKTESLKMITRMKFSYSFKDEKSSVCKTDLQDKCDTITHWGSSIRPSGIQNILLTTQSARKFQVAKIRFQEKFNNPFQKKNANQNYHAEILFLKVRAYLRWSVFPRKQSDLSMQESSFSLAQCYLCTFVCVRLFVLGSPNQFICMLVMFFNRICLAGTI